MKQTGKFPIPPVLLALDVFGVLLVALGAMALSGNDLGHPVLVTVAPGLIALGVLLMVPMIIWVVRKAKRTGGTPR
jgi:hypothetical protein